MDSTMTNKITMKRFELLCCLCVPSFAGNIFLRSLVRCKVRVEENFSIKSTTVPTMEIIDISEENGLSKWVKVIFPHPFGLDLASAPLINDKPLPTVLICKLSTILPCWLSEKRENIFLSIQTQNLFSIKFFPVTISMESTIYRVYLCETTRLKRQIFTCFLN